MHVYSNHLCDSQHSVRISFGQRTSIGVLALLDSRRLRLIEATCLQEEGKDDRYEAEERCRLFASSTLVWCHRWRSCRGG